MNVTDDRLRRQTDRPRYGPMCRNRQNRCRAVSECSSLFMKSRIFILALFNCGGSKQCELRLL